MTSDQLFLEGFITTPLSKHSGNLALELTAENIFYLVDQLNLYVDNALGSDLEKSNTLYWLTHALHGAVKLFDSKAATLINALFYKMAKKDSNALVSMLSKPFKEGPFKGQNTVYVWMDELYSATYDSRNTPTLIGIDFNFNYLLNHSGEEFCQILTKMIEEGSEEGKNALLVLMRALLNAASHSYNQSNTLLIAELLDNCLKKSPDILSLGLTQEFTKSLFKGKSGIYVLASILKVAVLDNSSVVSLLCQVLMNLNQHHKTQLMGALCKINEVGPYKGMHSLHILLLSLVSASYKENNLEAVHALVNAIQQMWSANKDQVEFALTDTITAGEHLNQNGIMMLVRSLIATEAHHMNASCIINFLLELIKADPHMLGQGFIQQSSNSPIPEYNVSPLRQLIKKINTVDASETQTYHSILNMLVLSQSAVRMMFSLTENEKLIFVKSFANVHSLSAGVTHWLSSHKSEDIMHSLGISKNDQAMNTQTFLVLISQFFLVNNQQFFSKNNLNNNQDPPASEDECKSPIIKN